jgi:DNA-binding NarL/FixJ family response regulator
MRVALGDGFACSARDWHCCFGDQGIEVTAQTAHGQQLLASVNADRPDVAILDIRMPPPD